MGERFAICLTENHTTGFRWEFEVVEQGVVGVLEDSRIRNGNLTGSDGYRRFQFQGSRRGTTNIKFTLRRAWETAPPASVLLVSVVVADP